MIGGFLFGYEVNYNMEVKERKFRCGGNFIELTKFFGYAIDEN